MTTYQYEKPSPVDLPALRGDIDLSAMTDKVYVDFRWDGPNEEHNGRLTINWENELSGGDKSLLDGLVAAH